jgi:hypothetical protein
MESPRDRYFEIVLEHIADDRYPSGELMNRLEAALASREQLESYIGVLLDKIENDRYPSGQMLDRVLRLIPAAEAA